MSDGLNLISLHELRERKNCRSCMVIDLRSRGQYAAGHLSGAVNLPFEEFEGWSRRLPRDKTLVLYCERGGSAMQAGRILARLGYKVEIVAGGYRELKNQ